MSGDLESCRVRRLSLIGIAASHPAATGLAELSAAVVSCGKAPVALVDLYDAPADQSPWQFLRRLGY